LALGGQEREEDIFRRVFHEVHPDLILLEPEGRFLLIEQVRELIQELSTKPLEGQRKVAILDEADAMSQAAANALLKTLEEPPGEAVIILITDNPDALLPTIASRCYRVAFRALSSEKIKSYLVRKKGVSEGRAELLTRLSGGVFGKALSYLRDEQRLRRLQESVEMARRLSSASLLEVMEGAKRVVDMVDEQVKIHRKRREAEIEEWQAVLDRRSYERIGKRWKTRLERELNREKFQLYESFFEGLASFYRDVMVYALAGEKEGGEGGEIELVNEDAQEDIHQMAHAIYVEGAIQAIRTCESYRGKLAFNANPLLLVENLLLELHEISRGSSNK
jgi:DNA polymerase III delta prime subunit